MRLAPLLLCCLLLAARHAAAEDDEEAYDDEAVQVSLPHLWITHCTCVPIAGPFGTRGSAACLL